MLSISCSKDGSGYAPVSEDPFAGLNLPNEYFNYANIALPAHYTTNNFPPPFRFQHAAVEFDNTPVFYDKNK